MPRFRLLAILSAAALFVAACTSGGSTGTTALSGPPSAGASGSAAGACATAPEPTDTSAWGPPAKAPALIPVLVTNDVVCGKTRILFLYLDASNNVASAPDRSAKVSFYDLGA